MEFRSDKEPAIAISRIKEYSEKQYYEALRIGAFEVQNPNGTFRCPFCPEKKRQSCGSRSLFQHASGFAGGSSQRRNKQKACHLALARFLEFDLGFGSAETSYLPEPEPKASEIDTRVQNLGELQFKGFNEEIMFPSCMLEEEGQQDQRFYDAESLKMEHIAQDHVLKILQEQVKINHELKTRNIQHNWHTWALSKCKVLDESEWLILKGQKQQNVERINSLRLASMEMKKSHDNVSRLNEEHKKEKEMYMKKILQLEARHKLQLRIEVLKVQLEAMKLLKEDGNAVLQKTKEMTEELKTKIGDVNHLEVSINSIFQSEEELHARQESQDMELSGKLQQMNHLRDADYAVMLSKMEEMEKKLNDKDEDMNNLEDINKSLVIKLQQSNEELQDARRVSITCLLDTFPDYCPTIGVKRMGEIDGKAFIMECRKRYAENEALTKAGIECSVWQETLKDTAWHPFKITEFHGKTMELINEEDERLKKLKAQWGDEVYKEVTTALRELNEYNPSGRYVVNELWNYEKRQKATIAEVVDFAFQFLKTHPLILSRALY